MVKLLVIIKLQEYQGKTIEEAIENAKIDLQEVEENLIIKQKEEITDARKLICQQQR